MTPELKLFLYALVHCPDQVALLDARKILVDAVRMNAKREARVTLAVPDGIAKALRDVADDADTILVVRIPAAVRKRSEALIVEPGQILVAG